MVSGTTKSGIKFTIDERIKDDTRLYFILNNIQSDDTDTQGKALFSLLSMIFGGIDNVMAFQDEVAKRHEGICDAVTLVAELKDIIGALNEKKS